MTTQAVQRLCTAVRCVLRGVREIRTDFHEPDYRLIGRGPRRHVRVELECDYDDVSELVDAVGVVESEGIETKQIAVEVVKVPELPEEAAH